MITTPSRLWQRDWARLGLTPPFSIWILRQHYAQPKRYYHTFSHALECLEAVDRFVPDDLPSLPNIRIALWFHDAIYDPRRTDNERMSAELAERSIDHAGGSAELAGDVARLIRATSHNRKVTRRDERLIVDADLSPLANTQKIRALDDAIRKEYEWVERDVFARKRVEILQAFVQRKSLFLSPEFASLEKVTRENVAWIIARWQ